MRRAARVDQNQVEIVEALRSVGCQVQSLASVGGGVPDLLVGIPGCRDLMLIEVKDGTKPPSDRKLTPEQEKWHAAWQGFPVYVVTSVPEALEKVKP
jgi:hypothetical protein